jgi:hypothetical protein
LKSSLIAATENVEELEESLKNLTEMLPDYQQKVTHRIVDFATIKKSSKEM